MTIQVSLPDSAKKDDSVLIEQKRFNELLFHLRSLEDVDNLQGVNSRDRARLKEAFSARNPEKVLSKAIEKRKKAKK